MKKTLLIIAALFSALFILNNALPYFDFNSQSYFKEDIYPFRYALIIHIVFGIFALVAGTFQLFFNWQKDKKIRHRRVGLLYIFSILISVISSIYLSVFHAILHKSYITFGVGLLGLALAWIITTLMAYASILKRHIDQHQEWMIRSYVVTLGFVFFRIVFGFLEQVVHLPHIDSGNIAAWSCWSVPLLICEVVLQRNKTRTL
jgi:MFS family permease